MYIDIRNCYVKGLYGECYKVREHPYYKALHKKSRDIYDETLKNNTHQRKKDSGTWRGLQLLKRKIKKEGYNTTTTQPMVFVKNERGNYVCIHGRHRCCILFYLHKHKMFIKITNDQIYDVYKSK
jgi:hypothetical protein